MSDLETRLTEGLRGTAGRAPHPGDLAAAARQRLRRRRRTTAATVAAALAVAAIPVAVTVVGGGGESDRRESTVADPVPAEWRVESFRDLTLRVPPGWGWGGGTDWCANDRDLDDQPQVSRPGGVVAAIACTPSYGYGVHFEEPPSGALPPGTEGAVQEYTGDRYPDGAWIAHVSTGHAALWVVTDDQRLTRQVLGTVEQIRDFDPNGCPIPEGRVFEHDNPASVCRYGGGGRLEQSERLTPAQTDALRKALREAPRRTGGGECRGAGSEWVLILVDGWKVPVIWDAPCRGGNGALFHGRPIALTEEIMYWALSPGWSGAVDGDVPLPERLRPE